MIALLAGSSSGPVRASEPADWQLDRREAGIDVYTRSVRGSPIKAFRGTTEIARGVDGVLALLGDADGYVRWFPSCSESRLLSRNGSESYRYTVLEMPWPVADRDQVLRAVARRSPGTGVVEIDLFAAPDELPETPGRVRVRRARGHWRLEPVGAGRTRVTFDMHLEPGGDLPHWLVNRRVVETPFEALGNLRAALESPTP